MSGEHNLLINSNDESYQVEQQNAWIHTVKPVHERLWWQAFHAFDFLLGGTTFIAGTSALFGSDTLQHIDGYFIAAATLYTIGSFGFLFVDLQEFITFTENLFLRINIGMSATGSFFYVLGSIGYFPYCLKHVPNMGYIGFIVGSFFIGCSQLWKVFRIGCDGKNWRNFRIKHLLHSRDNFTSAGVELNAGFGAWCFFIGTMWDAIQQPAANTTEYNWILVIWLLGSCFFTLGGIFLSYRHFVMKV